MKLRLILVGLLGVFIGNTLLPTNKSNASGNGVLNSDNYWSYAGDKYYYRGNYAYNRYYAQPYYSYGVYYPGSYVYTYSHTYTPQTYTAPTPAYTDPGWRSKLLDIAAARDKAESNIRKSAFEQAHYMDAVKALGLQGNFHWQGYGVAPPYPSYAYGVPHSSYGNLQLSNAGVQGNTLYGYSYNSIASVYGDTNLSQLYQQANRLAENAQRLSGQATTDFSALVGAEGSNRARVAEILAKSQAVQEMLRAMQDGNAKVETKTFTFKMVQGANGAMEIQKVPNGPPNGNGVANPEQLPAPGNGQVDQAKWQQSAMSCVACHSGQKKEGAFDVTQYQTLTPDQKMKVVNRLTTSDDAKRMPRTQDGKVGPKMSLGEVSLWLN